MDIADSYFVMPGLVPGIHDLHPVGKDVAGRDERGHDVLRGRA
jgi:hypothetical protein